MPLTATQRASAFGLPGKVPKETVVTPWGISTLVHPLVRDRFVAACKDAAKLAWNPLRIDSYNPRPIRGTEDRAVPLWSMHAYCLAWDFFATGPTVPPPGGVWEPDDGLPVGFAACFERQGFRWGGRWTGRRDVPHIEWADAPPVGPPKPPIQPTPPPVLQEDPDMLIITCTGQPTRFLTGFTCSVIDGQTVTNLKAAGIKTVAFELDDYNDLLVHVEDGLGR